MSVPVGTAMLISLLRHCMQTIIISISIAISGQAELSHFVSCSQQPAAHCPLLLRRATGQAQSLQCNPHILPTQLTHSKLINALVQGTILPGVTRKSVIQLAQAKGFEVIEGDCPITEAMEADEIFTCGTAVVVQSVGSLTYRGQRKQYTAGGPGPVALEMYEDLTAIQQERAEDTFGWVREVPFKV
ncbi:hypothetical protein MMC29_000911 [Sticta canariensis]|nr:hypothetical protein [Sticta canariensis]